MTFDLQEFGQKGVQGLVVKRSDAVVLVKKHGKGANAANLYCLAGTSQGHLVFVPRDETKPALEAGPVTLANGASGG